MDNAQRGRLAGRADEVFQFRTSCKMVKKKKMCTLFDKIYSEGMSRAFC